jgi:excisionase family DNA binding protein
MDEKLQQALTVHDVALLLNVTEKTIYRLAQRRDLPGFKVAGAWRFLKSDILTWVELQKKDHSKLETPLSSRTKN